MSERASRSAQRLRLALPLLIVLIGAALMIASPLPLQGLRNNMFDQYQRWQPRVQQDAPVRIIDIDEESLHRLGQWPWPRSRIAAMVQRMRHAGAAAIGFDVVFSEPDRTSPQAMARQWLGPETGLAPVASALAPQQQEQLAALLAQLPDNDALLRHTLSGGGVVLGFTLSADPRSTAAAAATAPVSTAPYVQRGPSVLPWLYQFPAATLALAPLREAAAGNGVLSFVPDADGVVRRVPLVLRYREQPVPSLDAEMLRVAQGARMTVLESATALGGAGAGLQSLRIGALTLPTTASGEAWVHYARPSSERYLPAWQLVSGLLPPDSLKGKLLLVGSSAQGLMDLRVSPLGQIIPGVEVHAQALEQMLSGHVLLRPGWGEAAEILLMAALAFAVGLLALRARSLLAAALTVATLAGLFGTGWLAFSRAQLLLDPLTPSLVVLASWVLCSLVHHVMTERQQRWLTNAFARYVSPNRVDYLVKHPEGLQLGGTRQNCSFIFTDLQGFTALMERMNPAETVSLLNGYLDGLVAVAFEHEGTLDRITGDAVAVVFSAPVAQADHRQRAFDCALAMHAFAQRYAAEVRARGVDFGHTRIGVHTGDVIVGNFGGKHVFDYRALGDPVNTAARLESVNKRLGTLICISEAVYEGCREALARPVARLVLKGKRQPLMVYEPVLEADAAARAPLAGYCAAYARLAQPGTVALDAFSALAQQHPADPLVRLHHERLLRGESGEEIVMTEK